MQLLIEGGDYLRVASIQRNFFLSIHFESSSGSKAALKNDFQIHHCFSGVSNYDFSCILSCIVRLRYNILGMLKLPSQCTICDYTHYTNASLGFPKGETICWWKQLK